MTLEIFTNKKIEYAEAAIYQLSQISDNILSLIALLVCADNNHSAIDCRKKINLQVKILDGFRFLFDDINKSELIDNRILRLNTAVKTGWDGRGI